MRNVLWKLEREAKPLCRFFRPTPSYVKFRQRIKGTVAFDGIEGERVLAQPLRFL
jgi:hypothetical protein